MAIAPPTGGPTIGPISPGIDSHAIASTSWLRGVIRTRTNRATGVIIAPPMPWRNRLSTKVSSESEIAQHSDPTMNTIMAVRNTLRAPKRSAIQLEIGMKIASATR